MDVTFPVEQISTMRNSANNAFHCSFKHVWEKKYVLFRNGRHISCTMRIQAGKEINDPTELAGLLNIELFFRRFFSSEGQSIHVSLKMFSHY